MTTSRWLPAALSPALLASLAGLGEAFTYTLPADFENQPRALVATVEKALPTPLRARIGVYTASETAAYKKSRRSLIGDVAASLLETYQSCCSESKEGFHIIAEGGAAAVAYDALRLLERSGPQAPLDLKVLSSKARNSGFKVGHFITLEPVMGSVRRAPGGRIFGKPFFVGRWSNYHSGTKARFRGPDLQLKFDLNDKSSRGSLILDIRESPLMRIELLASLGSPETDPSSTEERREILRQSIADYARSQGGTLSPRTIAAWSAKLFDAGPKDRARLYRSLNEKIEQSVYGDVMDQMTKASLQSARERERGTRGRLLRTLKGLYVEIDEKDSSDSKPETDTPPAADGKEQKKDEAKKEEDPGEQLIDYGSGEN